MLDIDNPRHQLAELGAQLEEVVKGLSYPQRKALLTIAKMNLLVRDVPEMATRMIVVLESSLEETPGEFLPNGYNENLVQFEFEALAEQLQGEKRVNLFRWLTVVIAERGEPSTLDSTIPRILRGAEFFSDVGKCAMIIRAVIESTTVAQVRNITRHHFKGFGDGSLYILKKALEVGLVEIKQVTDNN